MNEHVSNHTVKRSEDLARSNRSDAADGRGFAKGAGNRWHNLIATNIAIAVGSRVQGSKVDIYVNGMRVQLNREVTCYPDVAIVSGAPEFTDQNCNVLRNPTLAVEVFSNATNPTAKMQKLESYLAIASIKECLLVKADEMRVEHYARQNAKQWLYRIYDERDDVVSIDSVGCKISLAEIYAQVDVRQADVSSKAVN